MQEYLHNVIRATAGTTLTLNAKITDEEGAPVTAGAHFMLFDDNAQHLFTVDGEYIAADDYWEFTVEKDLTANKCGRYWYCICVDTEPLCFKQPFYLCK